MVAFLFHILLLCGVHLKSSFGFEVTKYRSGHEHNDAEYADQCPINLICLQQGICIKKTPDDFDCHCPLGYNGVICEEESAPALVTQYSEVNMKEGGTVKCKVDTDCDFALYVQAKDGKWIEPNITEGPTTGNISVYIVPDPLVLTTFPGLYVITVKLTALSVGEVCFLLNGENTTSVCYNVEITPHEIPRSEIFKTHNPPHGSTIICDNYCHMLSHTALSEGNTKRNKSCDQVKTRGYSSWALPTIEEDGECWTEIIYTQDPHNNQLWIKSGENGDEICYNRKANNTGVKNPCPLALPTTTTQSTSTSTAHQTTTGYPLESMMTTHDRTVTQTSISIGKGLMDTTDLSDMSSTSTSSSATTHSLTTTIPPVTSHFVPPETTSDRHATTQRLDWDEYSSTNDLRNTTASETTSHQKKTTLSTTSAVITRSPSRLTTTSLRYASGIMASNKMVSSDYKSSGWTIETSVGTLDSCISKPCENIDMCFTNLTGYFCRCPADGVITLCKEKTETDDTVATATVIALSLLIPLIIIGGLIAFCCIKFCVTGFVSSKAAEVSPMNDGGFEDNKKGHEGNTENHHQMAKDESPDIRHSRQSELEEEHDRHDAVQGFTKNEDKGKDTCLVNVDVEDYFM